MHVCCLCVGLLPEPCSVPADARDDDEITLQWKDLMESLGLRERLNEKNLLTSVVVEKILPYVEHADEDGHKKNNFKLNKKIIGWLGQTVLVQAPMARGLSTFAKLSQGLL